MLQKTKKEKPIAEMLKEIKNMVAYFIPLESIGEFDLDAQICDYTEKFNFKYSPADKSTEWETYSLENEGISLYVEDNKIISIVCDEECLYKGRNIIGMNIEEFISFYGVNPVGEVDELYVNDNETQNVYEFDDIGLQVWCRDDEIVTVIASSSR
jgi:hypothetical protein